MRIEEEIKQPKFRNAYQKAVINLIYTANWLANKQEEFFKPFGITTSQYNILRILRGQGTNRISGTEIKARMLERNSDISRLLDRLATKQLIIRSQCHNDKRAMDVAITESGLHVLLMIDAGVETSEKHALELSNEEAQQLSFLLDKARG
ncbi:MAG: MarR family transcriptional regulator [Cytophagales bacterium]|nr:MarR family transcriptional regulator [Cytophagales bacterium]